METLRALDIYVSHLHQKIGVGGFLRFNTEKTITYGFGGGKSGAGPLISYSVHKKTSESEKI